MLTDRIKTTVEKNDSGCLITCAMLVKKQIYLTSCTRDEEKTIEARMKAEIENDIRKELDGTV